MISALTPGAPLTIMRFAEPRFSPVKVSSEVVSRCSHSRVETLDLRDLEQLGKLIAAVATGF